MPTSTIGQLRYPLLTDAVDVPGDMTDLVTDLDTRVIPRFAGTAARNTAIPAPVSGQIAYVTGLGHTPYVEGAWTLIAQGLVQMSTVNVGTYVTDRSTGSTEVRQTGIVFPAVSLIAGRGYLLRCRGAVSTDTANTAGYVILRGIAGSTVPGPAAGTLIARERQTCFAATDNLAIAVAVEGVFKVGTSGTFSFGILTNRSVGSGNFGLANVGEGPVVTLWDMGASGAVTTTI